ncbi:hypothetical protein BY458DRAFT_463231 [Sporodiniella umbellata]|nr:hypothetical protein BY458DRAFT_463231 [Sporodiniella umbellata]
MVYFKLSSIVLIASLGLISADFASISECPSLAPRTSPPKDVTDVRVDDIKIVASLGDSIMAGFGMMGINNGKGGTGIFNFSAIMEFRGNSYAIGGDDGAVTIANFVKHYSPKLIGPSTSSHLTTFCYGPLCIPPFNICIKTEFLLSKRYKNEWKLFTIQLGSNDQCASCNPLYEKFTTPESFGKHVGNAIKRIQKEMPKTIINLVGNFKVSGLSNLRANQDDYCKKNIPFEDKLECSCLSSNKLEHMDSMADGYNQQLEAIASSYIGKPGADFAVMYTPAPIDLNSFPINALSNLDCFHPSLKGHRWIAKAFWNQMFTPRSLKPSVLKFDESLKIRCPTEDDRFPTTIA